MSTSWTDGEVFKLIEQWGEQSIQEQLEGSKRNKHVYEKLSSALAKVGVKKSGEQCRSKLKKLRTEFKRIKDHHNLTGRGRIEWKFYDCLNDILGTRPATRPPVVLETLDESTLLADGHSEVTDEEEDVALNDKTVVNVNDSSIMDIFEVEEPESGRSSRSSTPASSATAIKGKKRKRSKAEVIEDSLFKVATTITEGLKESDKMFLELEDKRMKFEEQQKREERQFQLQVMELLVGSAHPPHQPVDHHSQYYHPYPADYPPYNPHSRYYDAPGDAENS